MAFANWHSPSTDGHISKTPILCQQGIINTERPRNMLKPAQAALAALFALGFSSIAMAECSDLNGANITRANIQGADLTGATTDYGTCGTGSVGTCTAD